MNNQGLQEKYNELHKQGATAWFSDGREERETILKMGEPWEGQCVLEIGCGEGDLFAQIMARRAIGGTAIDYSETAIERAKHKHYDEMPVGLFEVCNYRELGSGKWTSLVMQGVLEHLDDPFGELQWMIEHFKPKTVITSSPCFLNPRGIVWMTLDMLGAVMSKTDLHYLHPWDFDEFCQKHGYKLKRQDCDESWGCGFDMLEDFKTRLPLAFKDGCLQAKKPLFDFLRWLLDATSEEWQWEPRTGATMVYRIDI